MSDVFSSTQEPKEKYIQGFTIPATTYEDRIAKALETIAEKRSSYVPDSKDYTRNDALSFAIDHHKGSSKDDATVLKTANAFYNFLANSKENK